MSANIVLPQLDQWAKTGLTAMFQAATESAFDEAFDNFIAAKPASIVVNGKTLTREQYKDMIFKAKPFRETGAQVDFGGAVAVEKVEGDVRAGEVGLFANATIGEGIIFFGAPETKSVSLSLNLVVIQDPTLKPPTGPIHGYFDGRRVSELTAVSTSHFNVPHPPEPVNPGGPIKPPTSS